MFLLPVSVTLTTLLLEALSYSRWKIKALRSPRSRKFALALPLDVWLCNSFLYRRTVRSHPSARIELVNSHISSYKQASYSNHNPLDERKLLLNKKEINKLTGKINTEGFTLVPTKMYFKKGKAKLEIAIAKGKKHYDKRQTKKNRDWNRDKARYFRKSS